jgi:ABC-type spermidine/putrescine transport system permease subunit II
MKRLTAHTAGVLALLALLAPLAYTAWVSFSPTRLLEPPTDRWSLRWYRLFVASPQWRRALWNSALVASLSTAMALIAGTALAVAVTRHSFRGRRVLAGAVLLPLFVPPVVLGMGLLPLLYALGLWGSPWGLALAHTLLSLPVVFLVLRSALDDAGPELAEAARGLGAGPWQVFFRITLPLLRPAVLAGAAMAFVLSLNEFLLALFVGTPETETLPRVLWPALRYSLSPLVAVASCLTLLASLAALALAIGLWRLTRLLGPGRR